MQYSYMEIIQMKPQPLITWRGKEMVHFFAFRTRENQALFCLHDDTGYLVRYSDAYTDGEV